MSTTTFYKRPLRDRTKKADYRRITRVPVDNGMPFVIVPEVAPMIRELCDIVASEAGEVKQPGAVAGIYTLGARMAPILNKNEATVVRRLHAIVHQRQLFTNAEMIEAALMALDLEHEWRNRYSEWPSCRADALEFVSIQAEIKGKKVSPTKLLARANRLYEKGIRKAQKRVPEVRP